MTNPEDMEDGLLPFEQAEITRIRKKYSALVLWFEWMGATNTYINNQCFKAEHVNALENVIYERNGEWRKVSDMELDHPFRIAFEQRKQ